MRNKDISCITGSDTPFQGHSTGKLHNIVSVKNQILVLTINCID